MISTLYIFFLWEKQLYVSVINPFHFFLSTQKDYIFPSLLHLVKDMWPVLDNVLYARLYTLIWRPGPYNLWWNLISTLYLSPSWYRASSGGFQSWSIERRWLDSRVTTLKVIMKNCLTRNSYLEVCISKTLTLWGLELILIALGPILNSILPAILPSTGK